MRVFSRTRGAPPAEPAEAADWWLAKQALGTLSLREQAAFRAWRAEPANAAAYDRTQRTWSGVADFAAETEIMELRAAALAASPPRRSGEANWRIAASVAAAVLVGGGGFLALRAQQPSAATIFQDRAAVAVGKRYETAVGERRTIRLDDGSVVSLNTGSLLEVTFEPHRRDIRLLRGQALFQVAKNRAWPFVVTAGDRTITAVGTSFDVRLDQGGVKVVLVEGKVRIAPLRRHGLERLVTQLGDEDLAPGQQFVSSHDAVAVTAADVVQATSWRNGHVIFRDDSLAAAAAEMNRYSRRRIVVSDPRVGNLRISGVFRGEHPENFVAAVTAFYPIRATSNDAGVTVLSWREGN